MEKPVLNKITQIGLVVRNVDEVIRTYTVIYGMGPWIIYNFGPETVCDMTVDGKRMDYRMRLAIYTDGNMEIELIEPLDDLSIYSDFLKTRGEGLHHIGYRVDDYEKAMEFFTNRGVKACQTGNWYGKGLYVYLDSERDLKHLAEIDKTDPDFYKFGTDEEGNQVLLFPAPDEVYPPKN